MNWRPQTWKNPYNPPVSEDDLAGFFMNHPECKQAFEEGADAMLQALKKLPTSALIDRVRRTEDG